jgi:hypothetical protein
MLAFSSATTTLYAAQDSDDTEETSENLTSTQRNSINMLNYMSVLTQEINEADGDQMLLETVYSSLVNDIYPNAVDTKTQAQMTSLMDTIENYRMISVKRERLEYIYEQNRAQALRQAIPNPIGLLSAVQSGSLFKAAASVLYMAVDSASSYKSATSQADLQFIKDGWELDDAEAAELHNSTKNALTYMLNMVRDYDLPGDYALNKESVEKFVQWSEKPDSQLVSKISWFEFHKSTYSEFGPYWLELAKDYYNSEDYENCLAAVHQYEDVSTRIFRKDEDYAEVLPMAIVASKETMSAENYKKTADNYCSVILSNSKDEDWTLKYFVATIYMDLYSASKDSSYLDKAYKIAFDNVVNLVDEQKELNSTYLADVKEVKLGKDATKREKSEAKKYNKLIKEERKKELPPVSEALYLNCDLLFSLADQRDITSKEQNRIDSILHENGDNLFLTEPLDERFWFDSEKKDFDKDSVDITFDGKSITVPADCVDDRSEIKVTVSGGKSNTTLDDWKISEVKRPKKSEFTNYTATFESDKGDDYDYQAGETVKVRITPVAETSNEYFEYTYNVVAVKKLFVFNGVDFERAD